MAYLISVLRGDDPGNPEPTLAHADIERALVQAGASRSAADPANAWCLREGTLALEVRVPAADPAPEVTVQAHWSTAEHLAAALAFVVGLAEALSARAYDRNAGSFLSRERVETFRAAGGFSPAARAVSASARRA